MKSSKHQGKLAFSFLMLLLIGTSLPAIGSVASQSTSSKAEQNQPFLLSALRRIKFKRLYVKAPTGRISLSASVRGGDSCQANKNKDIVALIPPALQNTGVKSAENNPKNNVELTTDAHPTVLFYLPENSPEKATFGLREFDQSGKIVGQRIYWIDIKLPETKNKDGIVMLNVADIAKKANFPELKVGKPYIWNIQFCKNAEISGLIRRVDAKIPIASQLDVTSLKAQGINGNTIIANELKQAQETDYPQVYAENGVWYSAVSSMAEFLNKKPKDANLLKNWEDLLGINPNLKEIAKKSIIGTATVTDYKLVKR